MAKGSTKYQLLQDDFRFATRQLREYRELIEQQRKEIEQLKRDKAYLTKIIAADDPKSKPKYIISDM